MNIKEIKRGVILSYALIVVNTFTGLFLTPFLISSLGDGEYGIQDNRLLNRIYIYLRPWHRKHHASFRSEI